MAIFAIVFEDNPRLIVGVDVSLLITLPLLGVKSAQSQTFSLSNSRTSLIVLISVYSTGFSLVFMILTFIING